MIFNGNGDLAAGVGGLVVSINKQAIGQGGGPRWRDKDHLLANAADTNGTYGLFEFSRENNWAGRLIDPRGATRIAAGGGHYVVTLQSVPPVTYGDIPFPSNTFALEGSEDGSLLFCSTDYQNLIVQWADGQVDTFPVGSHINFDSVSIGNGWLVYLEEPNTLWLQERGQARQVISTVDTPFQPSMLVGEDGTRWFLYHNNQTYLQKESTQTGYVFPASYGPSAYVDGENKCRMALTSSPGELPDQITLLAPFVLGDNVGSLLPPLPAITTPAYQTYVGFSWVPSGHNAPGNCQVLTPMAGEPVQDYRQMAASDREVFAQDECIQLARSPRLIGQIGSIEGAGADYDYKHSQKFADYLTSVKTNNTRAVFTDDGNPDEYPNDVLSVLSPWDVPTKECYPQHGEGAQECTDRLTTIIYRLRDSWKGQFGVVLPLYTQQNNWNKQTVLAIHSQVTKWINNCDGRLVFVWLFPRERGGVGGPLEDPDMMEMGNRLAAELSVGGRPILKVVGKPIPPTPISLPFFRTAKEFV